MYYYGIALLSFDVFDSCQLMKKWIFATVMPLLIALCIKYVGYLESKYRLRISLAHPRDCHFAHVQ